MEDKHMEKKESTFFLSVGKKYIAVDKEIYIAYYRLKEHESYLDKVSRKHNISLEECNEKGIPVEYSLSCSGESVEDLIIKQEMNRKLRLCIEMLTEQERMLIYELFFKGKSERQLSSETGIPQKTINDRKHRILTKLKKIIEN